VVAVAATLGLLVALVLLVAAVQHRRPGRRGRYDDGSEA